VRRKVQQVVAIVVQDLPAMLYDSRPIYRRKDAPEYSDGSFLLEVMIVLICPILLFVAILIFGYGEVFYLTESAAVEASVFLAP
jgi:hypothetical protein